MFEGLDEKNRNMLINTINTPCYIIDEKRLDSNVAKLKNEFSDGWPGKVIFGYSVKTNSLPWLIKHMGKLDFLAEVVSDQEYRLVKKLGFKDEQIIFNGPIKSENQIVEALNNGAIVNIDNFEEIKIIKKNIDKREKDWCIGLRYNFYLENECPGETIVGDQYSRFGFNVENGSFQRAVQELKKTDGVRINGLHGHNSTKTKSLNIFSAIAKKAKELMDTYRLDIDYIDIGGGFFGDKKGAPSYEEYIKTIAKYFQGQNNLRLIIEPGASITSSPISYLTSVKNVRLCGTTRFVTMDGSLIHINPMMHKTEYQKNILSSADETICEDKQVLCGFTCIEMDRLGEIPQNRKVNVGDIIEILNCGSYSMTLSPLFIEYFPSVYVYSDGRAECVRHAWCEDEFLQKNEVRI